MTLSLRPLPPGPDFWPELASQLVAAAPDLSRVRVLVPTYVHIVHLRQALACHLGPSFVPPEIRTLGDWLLQLPPGAGPQPSAPGERLMGLYAQLRELAWLKKLFEARRNTDLLPLARTLLALSDELTAALLPTALAQPGDIEDRWHTALKQLSPRAAALLTNEAQLVWNIWHAQRDERDPGVVRHAALQRLAASADRPLFWCAPYEPGALEMDFLTAYAENQPVTMFRLAWTDGVLPALWSRCWPELREEHESASDESASDESVSSPALPDVRLLPAHGLEHEAQSAAQTIIAWLQQGKQKILLVPQDRVVARRVRALLERAQIVVSDETGWKLSTTRAAAVLASWLDLVASQGRPAALLDFIKSPFLFPDPDIEAAQRRAIQHELARAEAPAGWHDLKASVAELPDAKRLLDIMAREAERCTGRRTVADWVSVMLSNVDALGMLAAMKEDAAGLQLITMLDVLATECESIDAGFSLSEWRALVNLQLEQTVFVAPRIDQRVMMVPLNGVPLREFDAAMIVGADADHLPSPPAETLFFANAVRRELGLATREARAQQQLRDFACLLLACPEVVISWQQQRDGEPNPVSPWIQRLQLALQRQEGQPSSHQHSQVLRVHETVADQLKLTAQLATRPAPGAPGLLPSQLSASAYNMLVACPYQFFASLMLRLDGPDELTELPEKRDYGQWLHDILRRYHDAIAKEQVPLNQREALLTKISDDVFAPVLQRQPAALGYAMRWTQQIAAYVKWANAREADGWQFAFGEQEKTRALEFDGGRVLLKGRLDRADQNADGELMVLDYKTSDKSTLKKKLAGHEDHQLAFYGLLLEPAPVGAAYVAIDSDKPEHLPAEPYSDWRDALRERIADDLKAIAGGAPLSAVGTSGTCDYCEMRGLCRKGVW